jgi:hypothetical protein
MDRENRLVAEAIGKAAFREGKTFAETAEYARKRYNSMLLQDCVLAGWNAAQWQESQSE